MLHSKSLEELIAIECAQTYLTPGERAAYRAGMSTAAAACDYAAREYGERTKLHRAKAEAAKLCGDMIEGLRSRIDVPPQQAAPEDDWTYRRFVEKQ